jgi:diguanylate cyclase (GGDEF)-like protein
MVLGASAVKLVALSFSLTETGSDSDEVCFPFDDFWRSSLATAVCGKSIYRAIESDGEKGFLLGLLLNIGQLALACDEPESYLTLMGGCVTNDPTLIEKETEKFGTMRYELAAEVLVSMGFPETISNSLACLNGHSDEPTNESMALRLANQMSYLILSETPDSETVRSFTNELKELTGMGEEETDELYDSTLASFCELASILSYAAPSTRSLKEIELTAKASIVEAMMAVQAANAKMETENNDLKSMAYVDQLTGLGNRRQHDGVLVSEMERCTRLGRELSLVISDIDHFKKINDTYGHAAGDAILAGVADRMNLRLRSYDCLSRIGGEEFALILPETGMDTCGIVAERLRKCIADEPFIFEDHTILVTISIGGTTFSASADMSTDQLFKVADSNLYQAKNGGRNQVVLS